jgi:hypothetical protein
LVNSIPPKGNHSFRIFFPQSIGENSEMKKFILQTHPINVTFL